MVMLTYVKVLRVKNRILPVDRDIHPAGEEVRVDSPVDDLLCCFNMQLEYLPNSQEETRPPCTLGISSATGMPLRSSVRHREDSNSG